MEDLEDVTIINSSLHEDSFEITYTEAEPLTQNNLNVAESIEVVSTEDSIICIDEDEASELPNDDTPLNLSTSLPVIIPFSSNDPEPSSVNQSNNDDDDFCIVFEKKASPSEVQILENYKSPITQAKKKNRISQNPRPSNQCEYHDLSEREQTNPSLDDSVTIVECNTYVHVAPPEEPNNILNRLRQLAAETTEKKKRKIECSVCFDGPDEIEASGKNLVSTVCGHIFCSDCITLAIKGYKHCPQCRKKLTMKQFHALYV